MAQGYTKKTFILLQEAYWRTSTRASARKHQRERYLSDSGKCIPLFVAQTAHHVEAAKCGPVIAQWLSSPKGCQHYFQLYRTYVPITRIHVTA